MSNDEFESWLSLVGRLLGLSESQRKQISEELRDHLELRVADLMESGMDRQAAVLKAVEEFGDAAVLAKNLQSVSLNNRKRWMMRFMTLATAAMFLVAVLTMAMWPEQARFGSPSQSVAQEDPFDSVADQKDGEDPFAGRTVQPKKKAAIKPSARTQMHDNVRKLISQSVDLVYDAEPFGDIREQIAKDLGINVVIDQNLEGVLDDDTEVTSNLVDVRLSDALRTLLKKVDATYTIRDGVLLIISIDDELEPDYISTHMIDVREVLALIKVADADRIGKPILPVGTPDPGRGGGGVFAIPNRAQLGDAADVPAPATPPAAERIVAPVLTAESLLVDTITTIVASDSWECNGTGNGGITCIGGVLVVVSSESVVDETRDFVVDLVYHMKDKED